MSVSVIKPLEEKQPRGESVYLVHSSGPFFRRSLAGRNFKQLVTSYPQPRAEGASADVPSVLLAFSTHSTARARTGSGAVCSHARSSLGKEGNLKESQRYRETRQAKVDFLKCQLS